MRPIGFSTGSLARGDFRLALKRLRGTHTTAVELSALRFRELDPLVGALDSLDLRSYIHVSVHAPGHYPEGAEDLVITQLQTFAQRGWPVVLHPDAIHEHAKWRVFGGQLLIENMDKRKGVGRTASELAHLFDLLPEANLCFDIAHARQVDPSMTEAYMILKAHGSRLRQVHISEVTTESFHDRISYSAMLDYQEVAQHIPPETPVILETPVMPPDYHVELARATAALGLQEPTRSIWKNPKSASIQ